MKLKKEQLLASRKYFFLGDYRLFLIIIFYFYFVKTPLALQITNSRTYFPQILILHIINLSILGKHFWAWLLPTCKSLWKKSDSFWVILLIFLIILEILLEIINLQMSKWVILWLSQNFTTELTETLKYCVLSKEHRHIGQIKR